MSDRTNISKFLAIFGKKGALYKTLVHDPNGGQPATIRKPSDINRGAVHNLLEYTARFVLRLKEEFPLINARGHLLREWGKFLGLPNEQGLSDELYRESMMSRILAIIGTLPIIKRLLPQNSSIIVREAHEMGFYLDNAYFDTSVDRVNQVSAVFTHPRCAIYVIFDDIFSIDTGLLRLIAGLKVGGVGLYAGVIAEEPELGTVYLDYSYLTKDYLG